MTSRRLPPLLQKLGTSFPDLSAMSSFRWSLITWSSGFVSGDYITNLVTVGLGMLEIGARQLNVWRLHELPDFLPFYQPGVPFNTPILLLAATSSIPTTWAVQVTSSVSHISLADPHFETLNKSLEFKAKVIILCNQTLLFCFLHQSIGTKTFQ